MAALTLLLLATGGLERPLLSRRVALGVCPAGLPRGRPASASDAVNAERCLERPLLSRRAVALGVCLAGLPRGRPASASDAVSAERWLGGPAPGLFPDCSVACVSSQDDRPSVWDNPWIAEEKPEAAMALLRGVVEKRLGGRIVLQGDRYLAASFEGRGPLGGAVVDDAEWYFAPNDVLVQFRASRRGGGEVVTDFGANRDRMEKIRIALGWEKVEVLRNRRRALVVVESPFDSFGPATYDRDEYGFTHRDMVPVRACCVRVGGFLAAIIRSFAAD